MNTLAGRVDNVEYCGRDSLRRLRRDRRQHGCTCAPTAPIVVGDTRARARAVERALVYPAG